MPPPFASPCWARYLTNDALHDDIPARDLTLQQATEVIAYLVANNLITLSPQMSFDASCAIDLHVTNGRIALGSTTIDGVTITRREHSAGPNSTATTITNVTPRLVVLTYRLARFLKQSWGASEIYHKGMGQGRGPVGDPHNSGRAIDFSGAVTRVGTFFVSTDWGNCQVRLNGRRLAAWPQTHPDGRPFRQTTYRLEQPGHAPSNAARFFREVYKFFADQASDAPNGRPRHANITNTGYIRHPDYPDHGTGRDGRAAHQDHIHAEIPAI